MIIKFSLVRLTIIFLLVILFPLVQNQWLNLYLFDINNFTIYKFLYFFSGVVCPILVIKNSLTKFTHYKFNNKKTINSNDVKGKILFLIILIVLILITILISSYFILNYNIFLHLFISENRDIIQFPIDKQIFLIVFISIFLLFKKIKILFKKIILINYFIISLAIWYSQVKNIFFMDILEFENINHINIIFLLAIEIVYYLWSYISYGTNLSDWSVPTVTVKEISPISNIVIFYLMIILYYSLLMN